MTDPTHSRNQGYGNIYTPHAGSMIIQVQRESGLANRTLIFTQRQVRLLRLALYIGAVLLTVGTISWVYLAAQAARVPFLTSRVAGLTKEVKQLDTLQVRLAEMERRFLQVQQMMGATGTPTTAPTTREPVAASPVVTAPPAPKPDTAAPTLPSLWPLEVEGYVTRGSADSSDYSGPHPGLDVAVPVGTPIRAAGGGTIVEVGDDAKYGRFVRVEHRDGYETLYAHASQILVKQGDRIPSGRTIALSGNTGQSTAPHLHFEVRQAGAAVDPMLLITKKKE